MIFNRFFRSKHLDPSPHVRIKAIEKLNKELSAEKTVLHELAFNDPDASVSLAALHKLDSFTLWYKMSEISKDERVQKKSQQIVEGMLFDEQNTTLNEKEKRNFISQCSQSKLLEKLVLLHWIQDDVSLTQIILAKLNKPNVMAKVLLETKNADLTIAILATLKDDATNRKLLTKLTKKKGEQSVIERASELLSEWDKQQQLPINIEKETKMLLSRLLALKESTDLERIELQKKALSIDYQQLSNQFGCLSADKKQEFEHKWNELNQRLQKTIDTLLPQWHEHHAKQELLASITSLQTESGEVLQDANVLFSERMLDMTNAEVELQGDKLNQLYDKVQHCLSTLGSDNQAEKKSLELIIAQILKSQETLANLPAVIVCIEAGYDIVKQLNALSLPSDISQLDAAEEHLRDVKQRWREATSRFHQNLPKELSAAWQKTLLAWQVALKQLNEQLQHDVIRCQNKLRAIDGLINQGRFRFAIELYTKVAGWFEQLPEKQQNKLQKSYVQTKEQIENLKDWQEYIATPRKPILLAEAEQLAEAPLSIEEQSRAVKVLRQQWNSLGIIESETDEALNLAFEETIEKAFAPCRVYYEEQKQIRAKNLQDKTAILVDLEHLNTLEDPKFIAKKLNLLQQQWRQVGEVEFSLRNDLYEQYQNAIKPLKMVINAFYKENAEQKEILLVKAKKCLDLESIEEAINQIKSLQAQWKTIEHAGKKAEAELWSAFREVSDALFAKRNVLQQQQKHELNEVTNEIKQQLAHLQEVLEKATNLSDIELISELKQPIYTSLQQLPTKERGSLERKLEGIEKQLVKTTTLWAEKQNKQHYCVIFSALNEWKEAEVLPQALTELPNNWQQAFNIGAFSSEKTRHELTIMLEIISKQESPNTDAQVRQKIQMELMAQKLQDGEMPESDELLKKWIAKGPVKEDEQSLVERLVPLFA